MSPNIERVSTVVSLFPFKLMEAKPGLFPPYYEVPASKDGIPAIAHVPNGYHFVYLDETRGSLRVRTACDEIARSIVDDFVNSQLGLEEGAQPAIWFYPEKLSLEQVMSDKEKMAEMKEAQRRWFEILVRIADDDWNKFKRHNVVSDVQRKAAELLNLNVTEHPWMSAKADEVKCPACGTPKVMGAIVCSKCNCIFDPEAYKKLQFAK